MNLDSGQNPIEISLAAKVEWLSTPAAYPAPTARVERIETHFAYVFLTPTHAYKLKKPLKIYGADLRSLGAREHFCREELRLNSRLARETYLQVVPLTSSGGVLALQGMGEVVDWLVHMRRLDALQMLDARLRSATVTRDDLARVIVHLQSLDRCAPAEADAGTSQSRCLANIAHRLEEAMHQVARQEFGIPAELRVPIAGKMRALYHELRPLLAERALRVREGHGDLRAEHIWLGPPLQIIDALEFDRNLRLLDPAEEVAVLAVDLERITGRWARAALCEAFSAVSGQEIPASLWRFYLALRASTRAKVALWHLDDPGQGGRSAHWQAAASEYLAAASRYLGEH